MTHAITTKEAILERGATPGSGSVLSAPSLYIETLNLVTYNSGDLPDRLFHIVVPLKSGDQRILFRSGRSIHGF